MTLHSRYHIFTALEFSGSTLYFYPTLCVVLGYVKLRCRSSFMETLPIKLSVLELI